MSHWIVKQPNGNYAVFSSVVDDFVFIDATREELETFYAEKALQDARTMFDRMLQAADEDQDKYIRKARPGDGLNRWREFLKTIKAHHGAKRVKEIEDAIKTGDFSAFS